MSTTTTTMAMEAMIESLKETSIMVQELNSKVDLSQSSLTLRTLKSMALTTSSICSTCTNVLSRVDRPPASTVASGDQGQVSTSLHMIDDLPHHSLEELSKSAISGCHLCLIVYLNLDSEVLRRFARMLTLDTDSTSPDGMKCSTSPSSKSLGFAWVTPTANDQATLTFRYFRAPSKTDADAQQSQTLSSDASVKSSVIASFDFANFESQRASIGYFFENRNQSISSMSIFNGDVKTSMSAEDASLMVDLTLYNPRKALQVGVRTIPLGSIDTASDHSFEIAKEWIQSCEEDHLQCSTSNDTTWKPRYLLDVSIKDSNNVSGIKLVDGPLLDRRSEYVTLSHAWGATKPIRLHNRTMPALRQGVARSDLPKSIADAAMVVDKLGYRYLWVDALCIMHDNEQEALHEMSQMHKIYENAVLNVAATCAWADSEGFIRRRNVTAMQPCMLDVQGHAIEDGTYMVLKPTAWDDLVNKAPLHKRAWVLQERALARRTLHFTKSELMWECRQTCCSEVHPRGIPDDLKVSNQSTTRSEAHFSAYAFDKKSHHLQQKNWNQVVGLYTAGRLSFQSDKLLAISGLARRYMSANNLSESDYVTGLWKPELPQSLLWKVMKGRRPSKYRAPTWSWASTDGRVQCPTVDRSASQICLDIMDIQSVNHNDDPFGLCRSAGLTVSGFLARGILQRRRDYWSETSCSVQFPRARVRVDFQTACFDEELTRSVFETLDVFVMPITCTPNEVEGLLLVPTVTKGEFKRLGMFSLPTANNKANCEKFRIVMKADLGMRAYEDDMVLTEHHFWFAAERKYTVTLV